MAGTSVGRREGGRGRNARTVYPCWGEGDRPAFTQRHGGLRSMAREKLLWHAKDRLGGASVIIDQEKRNPMRRRLRRSDLCPFSLPDTSSPLSIPLHTHLTWRGEGGASARDKRGGELGEKKAGGGDRRQIWLLAPPPLLIRRLCPPLVASNVMRRVTGEERRKRRGGRAVVFHRRGGKGEEKYGKGVRGLPQLCSAILRYTACGGRKDGREISLSLSLSCLFVR